MYANGKYSFNPVIWGPSYATGVSVSGRLGRFDYAAELKNAVTFFASGIVERDRSWF